jgi:hypothetical protein
MQSVRFVGVGRSAQLQEVPKPSPGPRSTLSLSEPTLLLPVSTSLRDLVRGACDEVPPHQDRLWERRTADQQNPSANDTGERGVRARRAKVVQHPAGAVLMSLSTIIVAVNAQLLRRTRIA